MKIGPLDNKAALAPVAGERKAGVSSGPGALEAVEASAKVALSSSLSELSAAKPEPSFDSAKVERIAQAIREGRFSVNAEAIADKLITNAQELLGRGSN